MFKKMSEYLTDEETEKFQDLQQQAKKISGISLHARCALVNLSKEPTNPYLWHLLTVYILELERDSKRLVADFEDDDDDDDDDEDDENED